jgi:hypothetical protein
MTAHRETDQQPQAGVCRPCRGSGKLREFYRGFSSEDRDCRACNGTGQQPRREAGVCPEDHGPHVWCAKCMPNFAAARHCCRKHESEDLKGSIFGRYFIVCPNCGDKRCPRAENCANACTGQQPCACPNPDCHDGMMRHPVSYAVTGQWVDCPNCTGQRPAYPYQSPPEVTTGAAVFGQQPAQPGSGEAVRPVRGRIFAGCGTYIGDATDLWYSAEAYRRLQSALTAAQKENADIDAAFGAFCELAREQQEYERAQLTAAQQRIAALHAALRTYGWHKPECDYMQEELPCTCGFMDAGKEPS